MALKRFIFVCCDHYRFMLWLFYLADLLFYINNISTAAASDCTFSESVNAFICCRIKRLTRDATWTNHPMYVSWYLCSRLMLYNSQEPQEVDVLLFCGSSFSKRWLRGPFQAKSGARRIRRQSARALPPTTIIMTRILRTLSLILAVLTGTKPCNNFGGVV